MATHSILAPSLLAADLSNATQECLQLLETTDVEWIHLDIMDGHFVPNLTFGPAFVKKLKPSLGYLFCDVHLMVTHPSHWIEAFQKAGADQITFHVECEEEAADVIQKIKDLNLRAGIAVRPGTSLESVESLIDSGKVDMLLIMTVEPGFGGQSFQFEMIEKIQTARKKYCNLDIQVDGGITKDTIYMASKAGANIFVAGSSIFGFQDRANAVMNLRKALAMG